jgi:hypothetical protein
VLCLSAPSIPVTHQCTVLIHSLTQVGFALRSTGHGRKVVAPEEVGTEVLKYLLRITADFMGHDQVS